MNVIDALTKILQERRTADPESSYVASLYASGLDRILKKVAEESAEALIAAKNVDIGNPRRNDALIGEVADLWFHSYVLLAARGLDPDQVEAELRRRER
jgi:phosphoribosyl-ATP pyrophosphohydrolase